MSHVVCLILCNEFGTVYHLTNFTLVSDFIQTCRAKQIIFDRVVNIFHLICAVKHNNSSPNMECVEGDWKDFEFKKVQTSDLTIVLPHLRKEFYLDEPLSQLVGISDDRIEDLHRIVTSVVVNDGLSFFVLHKESKKVAAVQIIDFKSNSLPALPVNCSKSKIVRKYLTDLYKGVDFCRDYNAPVSIELLMTSVAREFRGQGLVHEIYARAIQMSKNLKYSLISGSFTHPGTRRSAMKHGFQEVQRRLFSDHKDEKTSECLFPNATNPDDYAAFMVLPIS